MIKSIEDLKLLWKMLVTSNKVVINGCVAHMKDYVELLDRIARGKDNINAFTIKNRDLYLGTMA